MKKIEVNIEFENKTKKRSEGMELKTGNYDRNKVINANLIVAQMKDRRHANSFAIRLSQELGKSSL